MSRIDELQAIIKNAQAEIEEINRKEQRVAHEKGLATPSKWNAMTPEQQRYCQFMGYDPDNPDIPLD